MSNERTAQELADIIKNSPAGPLLKDYFELRLAKIKKDKDSVGEYDKFVALRAQQVIIEQNISKLTREHE